MPARETFNVAERHCNRRVNRERRFLVRKRITLFSTGSIVFIALQYSAAIYRDDYSINRANFHDDLNFMVREVREQISQLAFSLPVSPRVSAVGTLLARPFISVKYFIKQPVAFRSRRPAYKFEERQAAASIHHSYMSAAACVLGPTGGELCIASRMICLPPCALDYAF